MRKLILPILALLITIQLMAESELKTKSISIFKNGKSFVIKEGNASTIDNVYTLQKTPNALFGTLWFTGLKTDIVKVTSKLEQVDETIERKASSFTDLLYANKGKLITLTTNDDNVYSGIVEDYNLPEEINTLLQLKEDELKEKYGSTYNTDFRIFPPETPVLLIKIDNKWVAIAPSTVKTIEFTEKPEKVTKLNIKVKKPVVKIQFAKGGIQPLSMMYLQNGISWTPAFLLELISDTEARLRLQAEVVNDAEDIVDTSVNFVVGVPNFKFADNPATLTSFVTQALRDIGYNYRDNRFSNALMTQVADYSYSEKMSNDEAGGNIDADTSEDFYFYNVNNISLEKGGRAYYPLFNVPVKIKHLYECNLPPMQDEQKYRNYDNDSQLSFDIKRCTVFHSIEIKNDTKTPFTTGSVMIVDGKTERPLAEDLIKYTGVGQTSSIQLTQSPDIRVEEQEKIIDTRQQGKKQNGYSYSLLTIQSEVVIMNSKKQNVEMSINKLISGKSKTASVKYESRQIPGSNSINPIDRLKFNLNVKAGETLKYTYTYEMYVRD